MKIMSWNCGGCFREDIKRITDKNDKTFVDADIYIICECENPDEPLAKYEEYRNILSELVDDNYIWIGDYHYKGLGVFAKNDIKLDKIETIGEYKNFIALRVNDSFNLLAVWAMDKDKENGLNPYVEMIHDFFDDNTELFDENLIICGDFNSNAVFNDKHKSKDDNGKCKDHTNLDIKLNDKGLYSLYHMITDEENGDETQHTFYQARHLNDYYHIDYFYANKDLIDKTTLSKNGRKVDKNLHNTFEILDSWKWICISDHLPLVFEFKDD